MLKNYLKIALRNIRKYRVYSGINILGLSIGLAACATVGVGGAADAPDTDTITVTHNTTSDQIFLHIVHSSF